MFFATLEVIFKSIFFRRISLQKSTYAIDMFIAVLRVENYSLMLFLSFQDVGPIEMSETVGLVFP